MSCSLTRGREPGERTQKRTENEQERSTWKATRGAILRHIPQQALYVFILLSSLGEDEDEDGTITEEEQERGRDRDRESKLHQSKKRGVP